MVFPAAAASGAGAPGVVDLGARAASSASHGPASIERITSQAPILSPSNIVTLHCDENNQIHPQRT